MFPQLTQLADFGILLLRLMIGVVFVTSGWNHLTDPEARSKSIGMSKNFTIFLGAGEVLASLGVMLGVLTQLAAMGLILILLGAIYKKISVWHTGFWGDKTYGWHYDLILIVMSLAIIFTNGGRWVLLNWPPGITVRFEAFAYLGLLSGSCLFLDEQHYSRKP